MAELNAREAKAMADLVAAAAALTEEIEAAVAGDRPYLEHHVADVMQVRSRASATERIRNNARALVERYEEAYGEARHLGLVP